MIVQPALFDYDAPGKTAPDSQGVRWSVGSLIEANMLLSEHHYLGPVESGGARVVVTGYLVTDQGERPVAVQVWRRPTSRALPADGSWLELSRWCLTPAAGPNAGSRQHRASLTVLRTHLPEVTTLVSYSDPSQGHTGALYRACNWLWAPSWLRLRPPPTGNGDWGTGGQHVKDRWVFPVRRDASRGEVLRVGDPGAIRYWLASGPSVGELRRAVLSPAPDLAAAARGV